jgi:hypothetical protein
MTARSKPIRCAIYTRVSTDSGLDQWNGPRFFGLRDRKDAEVNP